MVIQLAAAITSFLIAFLIVPIIIKYSLLKNVVDVPGRRKIHKENHAILGGIAIFCGFFISSFVWINLHNWAAIKFIVVALFAIFIIGVRDDLIPLRWSFKLIRANSCSIVVDLPSRSADHILLWIVRNLRTAKNRFLSGHLFYDHRCDELLQPDRWA